MPSPFTGELRLTSLDADCLLWRLDEPLRYELERQGSGAVVEVPAGFVTDGASIPRILQGFVPRWGKWSRPAVVHDFLCGEVAASRPYGVRGWGMISSRRQADAVFYEALLVAGVSRPLAFSMWAAVRAADNVRKALGLARA